MLAAFTYWQLRFDWNLPAPVALFITLFILCPLFGILTERFVMRGLQGTSEVVKLSVTVALFAFMIGIANWIWPSDSSREAFLKFYEGNKVSIFGINISWHKLITFGCAILVAIVLRLLLFRTRMGVAMRAVVDDRALTELNGGRPDRVAMFAWSLSAMLAGLAAAAATGMVVEYVVLRRLYQRDHLDQVLATFGLILFFNESMTMLFGRQPLRIDMPAMLSGSVQIIPGVPYPVYRLAIIAVGVLVAIGLYLLINRTRIGMLVRAGASNREMATAMGVDIKRLFTLVFGFGAALCAVAGAMLGPILAVQVGMGENILILAFVVIVIGGIGSIRGALVGSMLVGVVDTIGRAFLPHLFREFLPPAMASNLGPAVASILIYVLMAGVLFWKPQGLFPARG